MPGTLRRSSTALNSPFFVRKSIIAFAFAGPIPVNICSSFSLAVFTLTPAKTFNVTISKASNRVMILGMELLQLGLIEQITGPRATAPGVLQGR